MRASLFYNPLDLIDRLGLAVRRRRRRQRLRGTPASQLKLGHLGSLELLELLKPAPPAVIYDIGANIGTWTCLAKSIFTTARVDAFEPLTQHLPGFLENTAAWPGDVHLHSCALGAMEGTAVMHVTDSSDASSLLPLTKTGREAFALNPARKESVPVIPLDYLVKRDNLPPPDLLKLDVQGYELEVLRGSEACLGHARSIICEVSFHSYYSGQVLFHELTDFLRTHGFTLYALSQDTVVGQPLEQADVLFLRLPGGNF